jgi:hypothetical protein
VTNPSEATGVKHAQQTSAAAAVGARECPALGAQLPNSMQPYYPTAQIPVYLRVLNHEEQANIERFAPEIAKARDHFQLFRIFISNYSELVKTISSHLVVGDLQDKEKVEFDRVLLLIILQDISTLSSATPNIAIS